MLALHRFRPLTQELVEIQRKMEGHARDYGLFALDPFGRKAFDKTAEESHWTVDAGQSVRFQWRVVIHPGDAASAKVGELFQQYAEGK